MREHWLDRLARRAVRPPVPLATEPLASTGDERYSRGTAVKLVVAGAASLSLGLWRATPGEAGDFGDCVENYCRIPAAKVMKQLRLACDDIFKPEVLYADRTGWQKLKFLAMFPPRVGWTIAGATLTGYCYAKNDFFVEKWEKGCYEECKQNCEGRRALQSASFSRQVCEAAPPPERSTPKPPPAPNFTEDPCWSCNQVGGQCCGPFTGDPATGAFTPCACATPGVPCDAYGCG
jgi:hypothetical protein